MLNETNTGFHELELKHTVRFDQISTQHANSSNKANNLILIFYLFNTYFFNFLTMLNIIVLESKHLFITWVFLMNTTDKVGLFVERLFKMPNSLNKWNIYSAEICHIEIKSNLTLQISWFHVLGIVVLGKRE